MIEPLNGHPVKGTSGIEMSVMSMHEVVEKVNKIIEVLNKLTELKEQPNEQNTSNDGKNPCKESRSTTGSVWPSVE